MSHWKGRVTQEKQKQKHEVRCSVRRGSGELEEEAGQQVRASSLVGHFCAAPHGSVPWNTKWKELQKSDGVGAAILPEGQRTQSGIRFQLHTKPYAVIGYKLT